MWYSPQQPPRHMRRGPRFPFGIPFVFPFLIFIFYSRSFSLLIITMAVAAIIFLVARAIATANANTARWWGNANNPGQSQQYYRPMAQYYQPSYSAYEEGYRQQQAQKQEGRSETVTQQYDDYELPRAQYPEQQMPPMQQ